MKLLLLPLFLFLQVGGSNGSGNTHCLGCEDTSQPPDFIDLQLGNCTSYTTAMLSVGRDGTCAWTGSTCSAEPCHPELVVSHHQASNGNGVTVTGIVGDVRFGPIKFAGSADTEIYRGSIALACGGSSPYFFEVAGHCADQESNEQVYGWFTCSSCVTH